MFEPHQGNVRLDCEFDKVWDSLKMKGELSLQTEIEGKPFIAKATVATKGQHSGERVIVFIHEKNGKRTESARSYECCWGHYYNCYGTRIGMYFKALARSMRFS
ncbi:MAG: hypothetical protein ABSD42_13620 [Candidatus Bathyarchaeia archaeon]|jgi:hypothetical protein